MCLPFVRYFSAHTRRNRCLSTSSIVGYNRLGYPINIRAAPTSRPKRRRRWVGANSCATPKGGIPSYRLIANASINGYAACFYARQTITKTYTFWPAYAARIFNVAVVGSAAAASFAIGATPRYVQPCFFPCRCARRAYALFAIHGVTVVGVCRKVFPNSKPATVSAFFQHIVRNVANVGQRARS
jgi:hypothetical protein